jgi:RNA polymerase sigma-70 factor (ECF subfamily)
MAADQSSNLRLLQRIASGDPGAMRAFVERYGDLLWSLARRMTRSDAEAEDAVQDILVYLWQRASLFDPGAGEEVTFVSIVARRRLIDRLRRLGRLPNIEPLTGDAGSNAAAPDSDESRLARAAFDSLPEDQQSILRLAIVHGRTHQMIAEDTGLPLGTVKTHIRRGLAVIRERLNHGGGKP